MSEQLRSIPDETIDSLAAVLDLVRSGGDHSRADIAARTGLGRTVVAQRIDELLARGILVEGLGGASTGGRPARRLRFRADIGHLLVADVGATSIDVAVADLTGVILSHYGEPADVSQGPEVILGRVETLFRTLQSTAPGRLWGIGIAVPGPVEFGTGRPASPPIMPGWDGYPVRERFAAAFDAPVWVDNDVNVMALGEWRAGIAVGHQNVIYIKIGTGIGAGIISDGSLHRGAQGCAGDVGHIQVVDDPSVVCRCGKVGCLEAVAGGAALARRGEELARSGRSPLLLATLEQQGSITAEDVSRAAAHGCAASLDLLRESGSLIGRMLASVVNFFNPSLVVIGGGVVRAGDHFLAAIRESVYARSLPLATRELAIRLSGLEDQAGVIGAAAMVLDQVFAKECLRTWIEDEGFQLETAPGVMAASPGPRMAASQRDSPAGATRLRGHDSATVLTPHAGARGTQRIP